MDRGVATGDFREKSSSWWLPVGAGLAVLAVVIVLAKGTLGTVQPEPVAPSASPTLTPVATAPITPASAEPKPVLDVNTPPREVQITLRTIPPNASIRIDEGELVEAPYTLQTASSAELRMIRASAPNYVSVTRQIAFDQTREIVLELAPVPGPRRPKPRNKPEAASASPSPPPDVAPVKAREPGTLPAKRPRALDEDNPFAG
jgi:hypothetical protein